MRRSKLAVRILLLTFLIVLLGAGRTSTGFAQPLGVDLFRGAWQGKMSFNEAEDAAQINLYFGSSVEDGPNAIRMSGQFSVDELGGAKRAKVESLPLIAEFTGLGNGVYEVFILANVMVNGADEEPTVTVMKLTGTAKMGLASLQDDTLEGTCHLRNPEGELLSGTWSAKHLDRRRVQPSELIVEPPLRFDADLKVHLNGPGMPTPIEERNPVFAFDVMSNIVMDRVLVTSPDGESFLLSPYTDVFSPGVDWVTLFRFILNTSGLPKKGEAYTFTALDVGGNPLPGVQAADVWVGVEPPDPPTSVQANVTSQGIEVSWATVNLVADSFEPDRKIGWYQMEINGDEGTVYGASSVYMTHHLVPKYKADMVEGVDWGLPLSELPDGEYVLNVNVHSVAPEESAGERIEYSSRDSTEFVTFSIVDGNIVVW